MSVQPKSVTTVPVSDAPRRGDGTSKWDEYIDRAIDVRQSDEAVVVLEMSSPRQAINCAYRIRKRGEDRDVELDVWTVKQMLHIRAL